MNEAEKSYHAYKMLTASLSNENTGFPIQSPSTPPRQEGSGMTSIFIKFNMMTGKTKTEMNTILHLPVPLFFIARNC